MGIFNYLKNDAARARYYIQLGEEVLGKPTDGPLGIGSTRSRADILAAGRKEAKRRKREGKF